MLELGALLLWFVGSIAIALIAKRGIIVFLGSMAMSVPAVWLFTSRYGVMESGGIVQGLGAGFFGLVVYWGLKAFRKWKSRYTNK